MVNIVQIDADGEEIENRNEQVDGNYSLVVVQCPSKNLVDIKNLLRETLWKNSQIKSKSKSKDTWSYWIRSVLTREVLEENVWAFWDVFRFRFFDVIIVLCITYLCKRFSVLKVLLGWLIDEQ